MTLLLTGLENIQKAQKFRINRLMKINNEKIWSPLSEGPYCVLHWLPISKKALFGPDNLNSMEVSKFIRMKGNKSARPNLDGIRFYSSEKDEAQENTMFGDTGNISRYFWNAQIFFSGALEIAFALSFQVDSAKVKRIPQGALLNELWDVMDGFREYMLSCNMTDPIIVGVSLLRASNCGFYISNNLRFAGLSPESDRDLIILPEKKIESLQEMQNIEDIELPIFNMLWRSFGLPKCEYYDDNGKRVS